MISCVGAAHKSNQMRGGVGGQRLVDVTVFASWNRWITNHREDGDGAKGALAKQGWLGRF